MNPSGSTVSAGRLGAPENATELLPASLLPTDAGTRPDTSEVVDVLRTGLQHINQKLGSWFLAGQPVLPLVTARAWAVEQLLLYAWSALRMDETQLALVATGGFGRGELHPHSDIDLLVLFEKGALSAPQQAAVEALVGVLWDAGFYLGHGVRNLQQCMDEAASDVATATSLMESRCLAGRDDLVHTMQRNNAPDRAWSGREFFNAKFQEQLARHAQFHETAYNLEPNIKEGPGGLRDIQMIGWVAKRHFGTTSLHGLVEHGFLTESEYQELLEGQLYLWKVRYALHLQAGRAEDRLLFDYQKQIAALFGFREVGGSNVAVEQFMQGYYQTVTGLERLNERLLQLFREELLTPDEPPGEDLGDDFRLLHGYLDVPDETLFTRRPEALLELFLVLARHPAIKGVRASAIRLVVDHLYLVDDAFRSHPRTLALFYELLSQPQGVYSQLQRMNRYGLLAAFLPVFAHIVGRMQFDLFHVYTVDQHILFVVRNLRRFAYGKYREVYPHTADVFAAIERPQVLYLAALFHDIAKGRDGDHSTLGAIDALAFCQQLPMPQGDAELVSWLVREHLLMSQTAQKKDISDPHTVREFARKVGNRQRLDHLYLLTVADISATSPRLWNNWKDGLLWELYQATAVTLLQDPARPIDRNRDIATARAKVLVRLQAQGLDPDEVKRLWDGLPENIFVRFTPSQLRWATTEVLAAGPQGAHIAVREREGRDISEILVFAGDYTGLFATTTAVLDEMGLNVLSARVVTSTDQRSFDLFQVMDGHGQPLNTSDAAKVKRRLGELLQARKVLEPMRRRLPRRLRPFVSVPRISFSTARAGMVTEMEVKCTDQPGLLSQLAAAMVSCDVRIHDAMIATFGDRAEDTFLVTDGQDRPIDADLQAALRKAIEDRLQQD